MRTRKAGGVAITPPAFGLSSLLNPGQELVAGEAEKFLIRDDVERFSGHVAALFDAVRGGLIAGAEAAAAGRAVVGLFTGNSVVTADRRHSNRRAGAGRVGAVNGWNKVWDIHVRLILRSLDQLVDAWAGARCGVALVDDSSDCGPNAIAAIFHVVKGRQRAGAAECRGCVEESRAGGEATAARSEVRIERVSTVDRHVFDVGFAAESTETPKRIPDAIRIVRGADGADHFAGADRTGAEAAISRALRTSSIRGVCAGRRRRYIRCRVWRSKASRWRRSKAVFLAVIAAMIIAAVDHLPLKGVVGTRDGFTFYDMQNLSGTCVCADQLIGKSNKTGPNEGCLFGRDAGRKKIAESARGRVRSVVEHDDWIRAETNGIEGWNRETRERIGARNRISNDLR